MTALKNLSQAPGTNVAINGLQSTVAILNPMIRYLVPYQTVCDYWNYFWTYLSRAHLRADELRLRPAGRCSTWATRCSPTASARGRDRARSTAAAAPRVLTGGDEFLHAQAYGAAIDNQGNADCETGQRGYPKKLNYLDPQGRNLATDAHTPGRPGSDLRRPRPGPRRRDVHPQPPDRPAAGLQPDEPMRRQAQAPQGNEQVRRRGDRDRRRDRVLLSGLHEVRQPVRLPVHAQRRPSPTPTACSPGRSCGSPASTSARSPRWPPSPAASPTARTRASATPPRCR